jgi:hypothetical protein
MSRHHPWSIGLAIGLLVCILASCNWFMNNDRQKRISDCLARCQQMQPQGPGPDNVGPNNNNWGTRDQRTPCERQCHAQ